MPRYEYYCPKCDIDFEVDATIDHSAPPCPQCGDTYVKKCLTSPSFSVKGFSAANNYGLKRGK